MEILAVQRHRAICSREFARPRDSQHRAIEYSRRGAAGAHRAFSMALRISHQSPTNDCVTHTLHRTGLNSVTNSLTGSANSMILVRTGVGHRLALANVSGGARPVRAHRNTESCD